MLVHHRHIAPICLLVWITGTLPAETFAEDTPGLRKQALQPPQVFINPDESQYSSSRRMFQGIPGIERASNGRLWVSRFSGSTGEGASTNYGLLITSDTEPEPPTNIVVMATGDQGATFTRRGAAPVAPEDNRHTFSEPMIVELSNGELWMPVRASYGLGETRSSDQGKTWSPIRPAAIKHTGSRFFVRKLRSGRLLLVKHGPLDQRTHRELLTAFISTDDAATWSQGLMLDERYHLSYYRYLYCRSGKFFRYVNYFKSNGFSVRCLRD